MLFLSLESCQKTEQTKGKTLTLPRLEYDVPILWHWKVMWNTEIRGPFWNEWVEQLLLQT